jgi:formamidopyrimidine-DNA glycosylase
MSPNQSKNKSERKIAVLLDSSTRRMNHDGQFCGSCHDRIARVIRRGAYWCAECFEAVAPSEAALMRRLGVL